MPHHFSPSSSNVRLPTKFLCSFDERIRTCGGAAASEAEAPPSPLSLLSESQCAPLRRSSVQGGCPSWGKKRKKRSSLPLICDGRVLLISSSFPLETRRGNESREEEGRRQKRGREKELEHLCYPHRSPLLPSASVGGPFFRGDVSNFGTFWQKKVTSKEEEGKVPLMKTFPTGIFPSHRILREKKGRAKRRGKWYNIDL